MTDSQSTPLLEVHESATGEVSPRSVDVHVVLTGDRFFSGRAAFEEAEELRKLAAAVEKLGVATSALSLEGVTTDVSTGLFSRSSSVTYRVRLRLENLELLPSVLDAIVDAKKATLSHLDWNYDGATEECQALLRRAGARAAAKARVLAESVGARLGELHWVREERSDEQRGRPPPGLIGPPAASRARGSLSSVAQELAGLELAPKTTLTVRVHLAYRLAHD